MSNWGGQSGSGGAGPGAAWFERARPAFLIVVTAALFALGVAFVFTDRYQIGLAAGLPVRLDRFSGQVIGCVPQRGCFEIIPAGQPPLATVSATPKAALAPASAAEPANP